ncbi:hypothetical protein CEXT_159861 [Caerostris extrusa]|uniref:Uncharacterized protein n=1 Tax=Caerostris extrusa TaxID=172846 RepID=A0AAV4TTR4_CAEEX|nr:hypothetical protein CEXT_159861 [Caerostris extrusa]
MKKLRRKCAEKSSTKLTEVIVLSLVSTQLNVELCGENSLPSLTDPEIIPPGLGLLPSTITLTFPLPTWKLEALRRESDRLGKITKSQRNFAEKH